MSVLNTKDNLLTFFYSSKIQSHKEICAYVIGEDKDAQIIDIDKTKIADTVWVELARLLKINVQGLIDTTHSTFQNRYGKDRSMDENDTIKVLNNDADMLIKPIIIRGKNAQFINSKNEVTRFCGNDNAGIEKTTIGKENKY